MPSSAEAAEPHGRLAWVALAATLALGSVWATHAAPASALDWQPALAARQPWRAWTAALVHLSDLHLAANLAGAALVGALGAVGRVPMRVVWAWLVAWPLTQLGLLVRPDLLHYAGLSGVLHAGVAAVGVHLVVAAQGASRARGLRRAIGAALLVALSIKVLAEAPWAATVIRPAGWDIAIAPLAHASGLVAGAAVAALAEWATLRRSRRGR